MLIIFSGETADTLNALRYCKERGALIVGITNTGMANWQDIYLFIKKISNSADQLFHTSLESCLGWLHSSLDAASIIKGETFISGENLKLPFLHQVLVFEYFSLKLEITLPPLLGIKNPNLNYKISNQKVNSNHAISYCFSHIYEMISRLIVLFQLEAPFPEKVCVGAI